MNFIVMIALLLVIVAAMVISLVFATKGASDITKIVIPGRDWTTNKSLRDAHTMLTWVAVGGWITVVLLLVAIITYFVDHGAGAIDKSSGGKKLPPLLMIVLVIVTITTFVTGVLSILCAQNMKDAQQDKSAPVDPSNPTYKTAYNDTIIASSVGIGVIGLIVLMWVVILTSKHAAKTSQIEAEREEKKQLITGAEKEEELKETLALEKEQNKEKEAEHDAKVKADAEAKALAATEARATAAADKAAAAAAK